jgi:hypothetical protein
MAYDIKGTVKRIGPTETKGEKFTKRALILDVEDGKWPQVVELQATGDRCGHLDPINVGDAVTVSFNLRGREWTGRDGVVKVFNSCDIWKIEVTAKAGKSAGYDSTVPAGSNDPLPF